MKSHFIVAVLIGLLAPPITATAQEGAARRAGDPLIPTCKFAGALCGYVNIAGETVIAPKYDWAGRFVEGRASVQSSGLWGFVDETGWEVIPLVYDSISDYWNGVAQVRKDGRTALIDRSGTVLVPPEWDHVLPLGEERFLVGEKFQPEREVGLQFDSGGWARWSLLDRTSSTLTELPGQLIRFLDKATRSRFWVSTNTSHYLFAADGRQLAGPFQQVRGVRDGKIEVTLDSERIFIDTDGNVVGPVPLPVNVRETGDKWNLYFVREIVEKPVRHYKQQWGYVDTDGRVMIEARFDYASAFEGDVAQVRLDGDELLIDRSGAVSGRADGCTDGLTKERRGDRFVILGQDGLPINGESYFFVRLNCGLPSTVMPDDDSEGLVRADGSLVGGRYFWRVSSFHDGIAAVRPDRRQWGIIDIEGNYILRPIEPKVKIFTSGGGPMSYRSGGRNVLIDRAMAEALAKDPSPMTEPEEGVQFCRTDGTVISDIDGLFVYSDATGKPFLKGRFDYATCFSARGAWVAMPERQEWCRIDKRGKVLDRTCQCWQPLAIIEFDVSPRSGEDCYSHGLELVERLNARP